MSAYPAFFFEPQTQSPFLGHAQHRAGHPHPAQHHQQHRASPFDESRHGSLHGRQSPPSFYVVPGDVHPGRGGNSNSLDLDAQERQLVAQLEALRAKKAQAEVEKQRQGLMRQRQAELQRRAVQQEQQRAALQEAAHAQQARQHARQVELMRALESARRQAAEIEAAKERERRVQMAKAQQYYMLQHQRAIEEQRQRQLKQQAEQQRLIQQQASRQRQAREKAFWDQVESSCAPPARQHTPSRTQAQPTPREQQPEAKREVATPYGLPLEILKMLFGPDVVVEEEDAQARSQTPSNTQSQSPAKPATPAPAPSTSSVATPTETKPTPSSAQDKGKEVERQEPVDVAQQFIDDLFGAFSQAFSLSNEDSDEKPQASENKEQTTTPSPATKATEPEAPRTEHSQSAQQTPATKNEPATPAYPTEAPTPRTTTEDDDDIPVSAADLEAEKAQSTADLIQAKYRQHLLRVTRLEKLEALESKLEKLDEGWTFPETLDFLPSTHEKEKHVDRLDALADPVDSASSQSENLIVPPLAFTPTNVPYHAHAQALLGLLVAADAVSSDGDEQVRNARREFVRLVEGKLGEMEVGRRQVWEKMKKAEGGEVAPTRVPVSEEENKQSVDDEVEDKAADTTHTQEEPEPEPTVDTTPSGEERTSTAIPVAVPDPAPLPRADEQSSSSHPSEKADAGNASNNAATSELEATASEPAAPETVETRQEFSDSEDEADQKAEHVGKDKKEQFDEFVVV